MFHSASATGSRHTVRLDVVYGVIITVSITIDKRFTAARCTPIFGHFSKFETTLTEGLSIDSTPGKRVL